MYPLYILHLFKNENVNIIPFPPQIQPCVTVYRACAYYTCTVFQESEYKYYLFSFPATTIRHRRHARGGVQRGREGGGGATEQG